MSRIIIPRDDAMDEPIGKAEDLREADKDLLKQTKDKQAVKNVLQQIKDMEAAEKAKQWRPPPKVDSSPSAAVSNPNYVNLSSASSPYVNEVQPPELPKREPPKIKEGKVKEKKVKTKDKHNTNEDKSTEKKSKTEGIKKLLNFGKAKPSDERHEYTDLTQDGGEQFYEELSCDQSGGYIDPAKTTLTLPTKKETPSKRRSTISTGDIESMNVEDVCQLLKRLALEKYTKEFKKQKVSGMLLQKMDHDVLMQEFGFKKFDAIKLKTCVDTGHLPE